MSNNLELVAMVIEVDIYNPLKANPKSLVPPTPTMSNLRIPKIME
jgi:hypothetical protein